MTNTNMPKIDRRKAQVPRKPGGRRLWNPMTPRQHGVGSREDEAWDVAEAITIVKEMQNAPGLVLHSKVFGKLLHHSDLFEDIHKNLSALKGQENARAEIRLFLSTRYEMVIDRMLERALLTYKVGYAISELTGLGHYEMGETGMFDARILKAGSLGFPSPETFRKVFLATARFVNESSDTPKTRLSAGLSPLHVEAEKMAMRALSDQFAGSLELGQLTLEVIKGHLFGETGALLMAKAYATALLNAKRSAGKYPFSR